MRHSRRRTKRRDILPAEQDTGCGVPQADVIADVPENPLTIAVPIPTQPFDALRPFHPLLGRLSGRTLLPAVRRALTYLFPFRTNVSH